MSYCNKRGGLVMSKKKTLLISLALFVVIVTAVGVILVTHPFGSDSKKDKNKDEKKEKYIGDITYFSYSYGSFFGGYYDYELKSEDGKVYFIAKGLNGVDLDVQCEIDSSVMKQLQEIVDKYELSKWDGFNKSDDNIMDGDSFSLTITYENGEEIKVSGYMKYPKRYDEVRSELRGIIENLIEAYGD